MASHGQFYDRDFYAWANEQAMLLRTGRVQESDVTNIAEEIESIAKREKRELVNRLANLLLRLLKWRCQPGKRSRSWGLMVKQQRLRLASHLKESPSLEPVLEKILAEAYEMAATEAELETGFASAVFPPSCPWSLREITSQDWLPSNESLT